MMTPPIGVPDLNMSAAAAPYLTTQPQTVPNIPIQKSGLFGGMFGGGGNAQMALMAAISGLMARRHPEVSQMMQGLMVHRMSQQQAEQTRQQDLADKKSMYDYELAHPKPINNDTSNDYAFWQQHLTPDQFEQWKQKQYDPAVSIPLPGGSMYVGPRSGLAAAVGGQAPPATPKPVGKLTLLGAGGQSQSGSGNFPY